MKFWHRKKQSSGVQLFTERRKEVYMINHSDHGNAGVQHGYNCHKSIFVQKQNKYTIHQPIWLV